MWKTEEELDKVLRQRVMELLHLELGLQCPLPLDPEIEKLIKGGDEPGEKPDRDYEGA